MACVFITADDDDGWPAVSFWMVNPACGPMRVPVDAEDQGECTAFLFGSVLISPDAGSGVNGFHTLAKVVARFG